MAELSRENNGGVLPEAVIIEAARFAAAGVARRLRGRARTDAGKTLGDLRRVLGAERGNHAVNVALAGLSNPDRQPGETRRGYALRRFLNIVRPAPNHVYASRSNDLNAVNTGMRKRVIIGSSDGQSFLPGEDCCSERFDQKTDLLLSLGRKASKHECETSRRWDEERPAAVERLLERFGETNTA